MNDESPNVEADQKVTPAEIEALFGTAMPVEALPAIYAATSPDDLRERLRLIAEKTANERNNIQEVVNRIRKAIPDKETVGSSEWFLDETVVRMTRGSWTGALPILLGDLRALCRYFEESKD